MTTELEKLLDEIEKEELEYIETALPSKLHGLYSDGAIYIDRSLSGTSKVCVVAEELGHYYTSSGDILDQSKISNQKQELRAHRWAHKKLIPIEDLAEALKKHPANRFELAEELGVTEAFLDEAIEQYKSIYGVSVSLGDGICLYFEPTFMVGYMFE